MLKKYIYLEHTADGKFRAFGKSLEEAFSNSALAMFGIMTDVSKVKAGKTRSIKVEGKDKESLLYNFLEELIFLFDSKNLLISNVKSMKISLSKGRYNLKAVILLDDSSKYEFFSLVKGITYNEMFIEETKEKNRKKFIIQAVVDL